MKPFVSKVREDLYGWVKGTPIPDELTTTCWVAGASIQLGYVVSKNQQLQNETDKIISSKHNAARTAVEQPCDLSPCFISLRKLSNTITHSNIISIGLQEKIKAKFTELKEKGELSLSTTKEGVLIDFLSTYPSIVAHSCPTEFIAAGFLIN